MKNAKNQKKEMYVFARQNASCGTPHPHTGRMSTYGTVYRIDGTPRQAKQWANHMHYKYQNITQVVVGGRRKMREFFSGSPMYMFEQDLLNAPTVHADDIENAEDWVVTN